MRDDSAEILFQSFLRDAIVSNSGMGRDVRSLTLSIQHDRQHRKRKKKKSFTEKTTVNRKLTKSTTSNPWRDHRPPTPSLLSVNFRRVKMRANKKIEDRPSSHADKKQEACGQGGHNSASPKPTNGAHSRKN